MPLTDSQRNLSILVLIHLCSSNSTWHIHIISELFENIDAPYNCKIFVNVGSLFCTKNPGEFIPLILEHFINEHSCFIFFKHKLLPYCAHFNLDRGHRGCPLKRRGAFAAGVRKAAPGVRWQGRRVRVAQVIHLLSLKRQRGRGPWVGTPLCSPESLGII